jgi:tRNA A-37 threonylcarbamoyl transferase component Bud32
LTALTELNEIDAGILDELAPSTERVAVCEYGPAVYARTGSYRGSDVLVVCESYANGLRGHLRVIGGHEIRFLIIDRGLFESDLTKGTLGDFLTEKFLYPNRSLTNGDYLENMSLQVKSRVVREEARDLVLEYGEMCRGLVAKPEFFGISRMRKQARVFLPSMADYLRLLDSSVWQQNVSALHDSFKAAILTLKGDVVELEDDYAAIQDGAIDRWLKDRASEQAVNILRQSQRAFYSYFTKGRSIYLSLDLLARELSEPLRTGIDAALAGKKPMNPKDFLYVRTSEGFAAFNETASFEDIVAELRPGRPVTISPLAGVLNEVVLVTVGKEQFVAKKFTDWHGFKWFTLNLVSLGSKLFAVSGKTRMANEYGINRYLAKKGLRVPRIIHVNLKQRILVEQYVPGIALSNFATKAANQGILAESDSQIARNLGETLARIHSVGVSVGDAKPENFVSSNDEIFTVDLEQAGRRREFAWDIAELLFYAGHYSASTLPTRGLRRMVEAFTEGYLTKGQAAELKQAAGLRYVKAFSFWTPPPVILEISKILNQASRTA